MIFCRPNYGGRALDEHRERRLSQDMWILNPALYSLTAAQRHRTYMAAIVAALLRAGSIQLSTGFER